MRNEVFDAVDRLLAAVCPPNIVRAIETGSDHAGLWQALEESGFIDALVPENAGGVGLSLADALPVAELCGRHAVPVPLAETMVLRGLLAGAGIAIPRGSIGFGSSIGQESGNFCSSRISCGQVADWALVGSDRHFKLLARADASVMPTGFLLDAVMRWPKEAFDRAASIVLPMDGLLPHAFVKAAQLSGALSSVFERTLHFANDRQQFGKSIGKFQAIQHQLAVMAEHVMAADMAVEMAATQSGVAYDPLRIAIAKARASEAAVEVTALGHSIHGAIGFTREYDLQLFTRRLNAWRRDAGSESYWHDVAGEFLLRCPSPLSLDLLRQATDAR